MSAARDRKRQETRRRLYEAALSAFRRDGVPACRIDDIAKAAGVSRGSFYFHYPTKDDVLIEHMRETEQEITERLARIPMDTSLTTVLAEVVVGLSHIWQADPRLLPDVAATGLRYAATTLVDSESGTLRHELTQRFRAAAERGELSALLPAEILSDLYLSHILGGLLAWYGNQGAPLKQVLQAVTALFWEGAQAGIVAKGPARRVARTARPAHKRS